MRVRPATIDDASAAAGIGDHVVGRGALSRFSERPAYQWAAEISVYVASAAHRRGIGRALASDRWLDVATWEYRVPDSGVSGRGIGHTGDNGGPVARGGTP